MAQVILVGKDWQTRALLRAQLLEEGLEVEAHESVAEAVATFEASELLPSLLIADLSANDDPAADVERLSAWSKQIPIWVIASRSVILDKGLKGRGFEMTLFRPVDMGKLVEQIKRRVED